MSLREILSDYWYAFQQELFPSLESELGPMGERYELFVTVLELVRVEACRLRQWRTARRVADPGSVSMLAPLKSEVWTQ